MKWKGIVAVDSELGIGKDNRMAWHCKEDMRRFRRMTQGSVIIMGRKTFESLGSPLAGRKHIVLSQSRSGQVSDSVRYVQTVDDALAMAARWSDRSVGWIIGGAEIFNLFADQIHEWHITCVPGLHGCDTFAQPLWEQSSFSLAGKEDIGGGCTVKIFRRSKDCR